MKWEEIINKQHVIYLDYEYFLKHYKVIAIDLRKQIELENPDLKQQINFDRLDEFNGAIMFFTIKKLEKIFLNFH